MSGDAKGAREVVQWELAKLRANPRNARVHDADQIVALASSMAQFGFNQPILVQPGGEIIAGHARAEAAESLGLETVPVIVLEHLDAANARAFGLVDNRIPELGEWDDAILAQELAAAVSGDVDMAGLGWSDDELEALTVSLGDLEDPGAAGAAGREGHHGMGVPVVSYQLVFEDQEQQARWFGFLRALKKLHPAEETIAGRLDLFLREHHPEMLA